MSGVFRHAFIPPPPPQRLPLSYASVDVTAPTLSSPTGTEASLSTADGTVSTNEGNGTLYWVVTSAASPPSVAQIQAGQNHLGATADASGNQAVSVTGVQNVTASGVTSDIARYFHFQQQDAATNDSTVVSSAFFILRAPTIDLESASSTGQTTGDGYVDTDESGGTLYWVVTQYATAPSAAQIIAGLDHLGAEPDDNGAAGSIVAGTQGPLGSTGLSPSTSYYYHFVHSDAANINSNVVTTNQFTTDAADTTAPILSAATAIETAATTADGTVTTDEADGTLYWVVTQSATSPSVAQIQAGQNHLGAAADDSGNQVISSTGIKTANATGLLAGNEYYFHYQHADSDSNDSTVLSTSYSILLGAPTLSVPTGVASSDTQASGTTTTNDSSGTLYWVVTQSATQPSIAQIKAGQDHLGAGADALGSSAVAASGIQYVNASGLTALTNYYFHFVQTDVLTNDSNRVSSTVFATLAVSSIDNPRNIMSNIMSNIVNSKLK